MKTVIIICILFILINPSGNNSFNLEALGQHDSVDNTQSSDYENIIWTKLLSQDEIDFYTNEMAVYIQNPEYEGGKKLPPGVNPELNGNKIRIAGYIIGVDTAQGEYNKLSSFLFVPNAGTCIHIPPPPPNQTIFVEMKKAVKTDPFEPVILEGTIYLENGESEIAGYYYRFEGDAVRKYE